MRVFYEEWESVLNRQPLAGDLVLDEKLLLSVIHQPLTDELNWSDFLSVGFSHHTEIISKAKTLEARLFYIWMGVATYRVSKDMPERLRNALPDIEGLKKLL